MNPPSHNLFKKVNEIILDITNLKDGCYLTVSLRSTFQYGFCRMLVNDL